MSNPNPTTNYKIADGRDLSVIFLSLSLGTRIVGNTNYTIPDNSNGVKDLADVFASLNGGQPVLNDTGYKYNNTDLRLIFADYNTPTNTTVPFVVSETNISYIKINNYYVITCTAGTSSIEFESTITNASIICVGGGGGGGGGYYNFSNQISYFGHGGGGGGNMLFTPNSLNGIYDITVGSGGTAGSIKAGNIIVAGSGGTTSFSANNTPLYSCSGGSGGFCGLNTVSDIASGGLITAGNNIGSGAGGNGGDYNANGFNSSSQTTNFRIPNELTTTVSASYGGGGGGAGISKGGGCGTNIRGGFVSASTGRIGQNATDYGSGGGGASNILSTNPSLNSNDTGGTGANGILIIFFRYPPL